VDSQALSMSIRSGPEPICNAPLDVLRGAVRIL